jgi:hypothetical protein
MNRISGVLTLHYRDKWSWIYIPAIILFSSFAVNLIIGFLVPTQVAIYTGGVSSIFIYLFVAGIIVVAKTFPFAVGMSIRRVDYFIGTVMIGAISSFVFSLLIFLMGQLENRSNGWGNRLHFFYFPYLNDGTLVEQFGIYMILFLHLFFLGFLIASFAKRFGRKGMFISTTAFLLIGSIIFYLIHFFELWGNIFSWFIDKTAIQISIWLLPFVLFYLLASFLLLRKTSV